MADTAKRWADRKRRRLWKRMQWLHQKRKCFYCGVKLELKQATWDHVVPKAAGGSDKRDNKVIACKDCNQFKGCRVLRRIAA